MGINMVLTVAVITLAPGAIPEFQLRIAYIRSSADGAAVGIGGFGRSGGCLIGACAGERDNLRPFGFFGGSYLPEKTAKICHPGYRDHIQNIFAKEQEIVGKSDYREEVISGKGHCEQSCEDNDKIDQSKHPCFDRDDKEQKKAGLGIHGGIAEEKAHIQVVHIGGAVKNHGINIHKHHTGEIKQIEFKRAPQAFHSLSQRKVTNQGDELKENVVLKQRQRVGKKPPDLTVKNCLPVEAQQIIQDIVIGEDTHEINNGSTNADVEHQIGNACVTVFIAESLEGSS